MESLQQPTPEAMVAELRERGILTDPRLQAAFTAIPRHQFIPGTDLSDVYSPDKSIAVCYDMRGESTCSATMPTMIANLLSCLELEAGQNVLEIGTGTGYTAAIIKNMIGSEGRVTSLEIERDIVRMAQDNLQRAYVIDVNLVHVDGAEGYAPRAAYDRIVSTVGIWDIPPAWLRQLKPNGIIVAPIALDGLQVTGAFRLQSDGTLLCTSVMPSAFVYIRGSATPPTMRKRIGSTALTLISDEVDKIDSASMHLLLSSDHEQSILSRGLDKQEYWYGFLPFMMMTEPPKSVFALYHVLDEQKAYGLEGEGFALFTPASACFVPYYGIGSVHYFAGADALLDIETQLQKWYDADCPGIDRLRLRLIPKTHGAPEITEGKVFERRTHYLHAWLEGTNIDKHESHA
ncbi:MAG: hypothetical protein OHK0046_14270 [Anaerolineae bacterium]